VGEAEAGGEAKTGVAEGGGGGFVTREAVGGVEALGDVLEEAKWRLESALDVVVECLGAGAGVDEEERLVEGWGGGGARGASEWGVRHEGNGGGRRQRKLLVQAARIHQVC
jgi:hypothetical protein